MSKQIQPAAIFVAALGVSVSLPALAWTPYGYGPYGPGYDPAQPQTAQPLPPMGGGSSELPPQSAYPPRGYDRQQQFPYGGGAPNGFFGEYPPASPPQSYPGLGPRAGGPWGPSAAGGRRFGPPAGFRLAREASDDAYTLTVELDGMNPEQIQVRTQGQWIVLSQERTEQRDQRDGFDDGRGFRRSFSYSSGTASRRLSVPSDGDLSAMSREDKEGTVRIRIPRRGR